MNFKDKIRNEIDSEIAQQYTPLIKYGDKLIAETPRIPAIEVAKVVTNSLTVKKPKAYYYIGSDAKSISILARLPKRLLDWMFYKRIKVMI